MGIKVYNFAYKGADRSVFKMKAEYKTESPMVTIAGIDMSHLTNAEKAEFKQELARHDAVMQKFIKAAYRKFKLSDMDGPIVEADF